MSLIGSEYGFSKKIDKKAFTEVMKEYIKEKDIFKNSESVLQGVYTPFQFLINKVKENWGKEDIKTTLKNAISNISKDIFSKLDDSYKAMDIDSDIQITESDFTSFSNIDSLDDFRVKKENIDEKFTKIKERISQK